MSGKKRVWSKKGNTGVDNLACQTGRLFCGEQKGTTQEETLVWGRAYRRMEQISTLVAEGTRGEEKIETFVKGGSFFGKDAGRGGGKMDTCELRWATLTKGARRLGGKTEFRAERSGRTGDQKGEEKGSFTEKRGLRFWVKRERKVVKYKLGQLKLLLQGWFLKKGAFERA